MRFFLAFLLATMQLCGVNAILRLQKCGTAFDKNVSPQHNSTRGNYPSRRKSSVKARPIWPPVSCTREALMLIGRVVGVKLQSRGSGWLLWPLQQQGKSCAKLVLLAK